jgi:hypothetical protein
VSGISFGTLPDGKRVSWDASSDLVMENDGGDYWKVTFRMYPGDELSYKFWSGYSSNQSTYQRAGWEGPVTAFNGTSSNTRTLVVGQGDTTIALQFYNSSADVHEQYWMPFDHMEDSLAVYFRVNMEQVTKSGIFDPDVNMVGVRGDSLTSAGILSWEETKVILSREIYSINDGALWSGVAYFPRTFLKPDSAIKFKYYIENGSGNGWESEVENRIITIAQSLITGNDTTIHWVYFNDNIPSTIKENLAELPKEVQLGQNYPNPFNPITHFPLKVAKTTHIKVSVYNLLGKEIRVLKNEKFSAGNHVIKWDGKNHFGVEQSSGIYFIKIFGNDFSLSKKALLVR